MMRNILQATVVALATAPVALGHTWIEQLRNINDQGDYVGEYGYPRGMIAKTDPGYDGTSMNWELPGSNTQGRVFINESTPLCHPSQRKQAQSNDKYPRLQAVPGGFIAMRYMENGHVTLPDNQKGKPEKGGTIFIYGTTEPKEDATLATVLRWDQDGQGGDKSGKLLAMSDFDDGRCYEVNSSPTSLDRQKSDPNFALGQVVEGAPGNYPLFCETSVQLPKTAELGKPYTFYWVWQWNTAPGADPGLPAGKDEYYTTCMDVDVASADVALAAEAESKFGLGQQDAMSVAVSDYASRTALMTDVIKGEVGPIFSSKSTGAPSATGGAPYLNSTMPAPTAIPTLTGRPGASPTLSPSDGNVVIVTDTVYITVTEPAATAPPASAVTSRAAHNSIRHKSGSKFRRFRPPSQLNLAPNDLELYNVRNDGWCLITLALILISFTNAVPFNSAPATKLTSIPYAKAVVAATVFHHITTGIGAYQHYKLETHYNTSMAIGVWGNVWLTLTGLATLGLLQSEVGSRDVEDVARKGR
ncbi:Nn.00g012470.m01.CDS01 [Neocucurbitaria sp. VM-36]